MFLFRWIKKLFFLAVFAALVWWGANYKINGRPLYQMAKDIIGSKNFDEGTKDLRMFLGGFLKSLGEGIQENVTEQDRKELETLIKKKVREENGNNSK